MKLVNIPTRFPKAFAAGASVPYIRPIPTASQIGVQDGAASLTDGFPPDCFIPQASGGTPPFGEDFNGILNQTTLWAQWQAAGGPVPFNSAFSTAIGGYPKGALCASATFGITWASKIDDNTTDPDVDSTNWMPVPGLLPSPVSGSAVTYTLAQAGGQQLLRSNSGLAMADVLPGTAPGVLPSGTVIRVMNADVSALMSIAAGSGALLKGLPLPFAILGPGQSAEFISDGANYWPRIMPARARLGANTSLFADAMAGNDSNTGMTSSVPFLTIQHMWDVAQKCLDLAGFVLTLRAADGTYTATTGFVGSLTGQSSIASLQLIGNPSVPLNCNLTSTLTFSNGARGVVSGFNAGTVSGNTFQASDGGTSLQFLNCNFAGSGASHLVASTYSRVTAIGSYTVTAGGSNHLAAAAGQVQINAGVTCAISGNPSFTTFANCTEGGLIDASGVGITGTASGQRYSANFNGVIYVGGGGPNVFPGSIAGTTAGGGQYG